MLCYIEVRGSLLLAFFTRIFLLASRILQTIGMFCREVVLTFLVLIFLHTRQENCSVLRKIRVSLYFALLSRL